MNVKAFKTVLAIAMAVLLIHATAFCSDPAGETRGVVLKVAAKRIVMPAADTLEKSRISRARIRSTELRELIQGYDSDSKGTIEKVFETTKVGNQPEEKVEVKDTYIVRIPGITTGEIEDFRLGCVAIDAVNSAYLE